MARSLGRRLGLGLLVLLLLSGVLVVMLWTLQRRLIYFPDTAPVPPAADVIPGAREVALHTSDGLELGAWFVPADLTADTGFAVLLAPGNAGDRADRSGLAQELAHRGLAVLLMDYRGYGGNPGTPSEDGLGADADAAVAALREVGYPPHRTIYFGESLGSGVVAALQVRHPPAGMVLRSPFTDLVDVAAHHYPWLPVRAMVRDRFPVVDRLTASDIPVAVIYGRRDTVIPSELSARVADHTPVLAERMVLDRADHNDPVMFGPRVADAVERLSRRIG
jgi:uncharacterized protein